MDSRRTLLLILLLVLSFFMFQQWQNKDPASAPGIDSTSMPEASGIPQAQAEPESGIPQTTASESSVPSAAGAAADAIPREETSTASGDIIRIRTDVLDLQIDLRGGDIIRSELLNHAEELGKPERYTILFQRTGQVHVAQSGLVGRDGTDTAEGRPLYRATNSNFDIGSNDSLRVPLTYQREDGTLITKEFILTRGDYAVEVRHIVENQTDDALQMALYGQLKQTMINGGRGSMFMPTYRGAAYSSSNNRYKKYSFSDIEKRNLNETTPAGWVAMLEHYFVTAWVPDQEADNRLYSSHLRAAGDGVVGFVGPTIRIPAGEATEFVSHIYMGPKDQERLAQLANHLNLTVDYGFLWWLAQPIHWLLSFLYTFVQNWGVAIILVTLVVKGLLYPLTKAQYTSMAKMRKIAPRMKELKERFGDDRQKMSQAMMKMYQEEKVNPLGGCLPMLLQLPIFLALYWVLLESPEIRHANFMLWISDLSSRDPLFILPLLMGASMYLMQRLQPTPVTDPMQQKILQWMPVVFTVFFLFFPAGLVLYWLVSNLISIAQMLWIYRQLDKKGLGVKKA
ncbi:MAG: membrane protein insertase YidC [Idiomarina sp.]|nr:membrane protein insertase YidC [Idiomarina sp.]